MKLRQKEVKFVGHIISSDGLKPDPDKITAIENMPKPTYKQELMSLLGFINYLARFLPQLAHVSQLLRDLTTIEECTVCLVITTRQTFLRDKAPRKQPSGA